MHTVDAKEIEIFAQDSDRWWDEDGPFRPLHRLNPVRLSYIKDKICKAFDKDTKSLKAFQGLSILDIGCGGGLVCEPMARLGANVTGIDADGNAIEIASDHAIQSGLKINYRSCSTDELFISPPASGGMGAERSRGEHTQYDVVLALEIVEHVADVDRFVGHCVDLCKPGGLIIFSTLNRTPQSFVLGKIAAEYILRWVPAGTHDWKKFIKPSELARSVRNAGGTPEDTCGMTFDPLKGEFQLSPNNIDVNYFMAVRR